MADAEGETQSSSNNSGVVGESILEQRLQRSNSHAHDSDDGKDPFEDFEELKDNPSDPPASLSAPSSKPSTPAPDAPANQPQRNSIKFQDNDGADWDEGVDAKDDDVFAAPTTDAPQAGSAYVKSKIQELSTVQEQVESTRDNPNILTALSSVLDALRKQIENAYEANKIEAEDHATLLQRLHDVHQLIASK